jgi:hypothetical protein
MLRLTIAHPTSIETSPSERSSQHNLGIACSAAVVGRSGASGHAQTSVRVNHGASFAAIDSRRTPTVAKTICTRSRAHGIRGNAMQTKRIYQVQHWSNGQWDRWHSWQKVEAGSEKEAAEKVCARAAARPRAEVRRSQAAQRYRFLRSRMNQDAAHRSPCHSADCAQPGDRSLATRGSI